MEKTLLKRGWFNQRKGTVGKGQMAKQGSVRGMGPMTHWGAWEPESLLRLHVQGEMKRDGVFVEVDGEQRVAGG